jgi:hydrogenase/urease accessory protein HupE
MRHTFNATDLFMSYQTIFLQRLLLPATILLLVIAGVFGRLTDTTLGDLSSGFSHPLEGWDHIVTMLCVGIWAAQLRGKAIWLLPATFVGVMSLGGISGSAKYLAVPSAEILIVLSCLVFSVLILRKIRFDTKINVLIVAFFAFFHGYAHGAEISASASLISYTMGFMVATLLLHSAGILVAKIVLLSITIFVTQALHIAPIESAKTVVTSYSMSNEVQQVDVSAIEIKLPSNFSPPDKTIFEHFKPLKSHFNFWALLLVFSISQFVCYVFYPKQRPDFAKFLARCFKNLLQFLTLPAFQPLHFTSHKPLFNKADFRAPKLFNLIL